LPGQIINGTDDNVNGADSIIFRYEGDGDGAIRDCLGGNPPGAGQFVVSRFSLSGTNELQCASNNPAGAAGVQTQPLIDNVENLQILYGIANPNNASAQRYLTAANVAANQWDDVVSVQISLLLRSVEDNLTTKPQTYTFNGVTVTPNDRRLRQVFTTTVNLRNVTR
jgi:type IV pilus assembly protein PilW